MTTRLRLRHRSPEEEVTPIRPKRTRAASAEAHLQESKPVLPDDGSTQLDADKVAEMWTEFATDHYEMVEQLPLELHRNSRLLREMDEESIAQQDRLQAQIRAYVAYRISCARWLESQSAEIVDEVKPQAVDMNEDIVMEVGGHDVDNDMPESHSNPQSTARNVDDAFPPAPSSVPAVDVPESSTRGASQVTSEPIPAANANGVLASVDPATPAVAEDLEGARKAAQNDSVRPNHVDLDEAEELHAVEDSAELAVVIHEMDEREASKTAAAPPLATAGAATPAPVPGQAPGPAAQAPGGTEPPGGITLLEPTSTETETRGPSDATTSQAAGSTASPAHDLHPSKPAARPDLGEIARLVAELVRNREEKVAIAVGAYNTIDRHIRALDSALSAQETTLLGFDFGRDRTGTPAEGTPAGGARSRSRSRKKRKSGTGASPEPVAEVIGLGEVPAGIDADPNEPRYCYCNNVSYGEMLGCDNEDCPFEWFHLGCLGLASAPTGAWLCEACKPGGRLVGVKPGDVAKVMGLAGGGAGATGAVGPGGAGSAGGNTGSGSGTNSGTAASGGGRVGGPRATGPNGTDVASSSTRRAGGASGGTTRNVAAEAPVHERKAPKRRRVADWDRKKRRRR